jgi:hypothetical protein
MKQARTASGQICSLDQLDEELTLSSTKLVILIYSTEDQESR